MEVFFVILPKYHIVIFVLFWYFLVNWDGYCVPIVFLSSHTDDLISMHLNSVGSIKGIRMSSIKLKILAIPNVDFKMRVGTPLYGPYYAIFPKYQKEPQIYPFNQYPGLAVLAFTPSLFTFIFVFWNVPYTLPCRAQSPHVHCFLPLCWS